METGPSPWPDKDAYDKIARATCLEGPDGLPISRAGEANDATNGLRPANEPPGSSRECHGDYPSKFDGGPRPSRGSDSSYFREGSDTPSSSRGPSEDADPGHRITGGRSDL